MPRLKMSGAIPLLPLYTFIAWTGTTLLFTVLYYFKQDIGEQKARIYVSCSY
jgi:hypothetical protein